MDYYLAMKKNEIVPFVTTQMDLDCNMLSEISQTEKERLYDITYECNLKIKEMNRHIKSEIKSQIQRMSRQLPESGERKEVRETKNHKLSDTKQMCHRCEKFNVENIVNNYTVSLYDDRW